MVEKELRIGKKEINEGSRAKNSPFLFAKDPLNRKTRVHAWPVWHGLRLKVHYLNAVRMLDIPIDKTMQEIRFAFSPESAVYTLYYYLAHAWSVAQ